MKKFVLSIVMISMALGFVNAQESEPSGEQSKFPYEKILKMTDDQLLEAKFKYNDDKNQYILSKKNGLNQTAAILGALNGSAANYVPDVNDYQVTVQKGLDGVAWIEVTFYDSKIYHEILTFANDQGSNVLETSSGKINKTQFNYGNFAFTATSTAVGQSATSAGGGRVSTKDQSYDTYNFTIFTGVEPYSKWLIKEAEKQEKRDAKGKKKQSAADLM